MILSDMVESLLHSLAGGPVDESQVKGPLTHIYEQAKAQEADIEHKQAEIEHAEKRITALELKLHNQEQTGETDRFDDVTEKVLVLLFRNASITLEEIGIIIEAERSVTQYHADKLVEAKMITFRGIMLEGTRYTTLPKGRAYVVENKLLT